MSSKSRKKTPRPGERRPTASPARPGVPEAGGPPAEPARSAFEIPDEVLHAPKEASKWRFALMILLVVVLLVIFIIPDALFGIGGGGGAGANDPIVSWEHPSEGTIELSRADYYSRKRSLDAVLGIDYFLKILTFGIQDTTISDEDAMRLIVLDRLARDAGVQITGADLRDHLRDLVQRFFQGDVELYKAYTQRLMGTVEFETTLRSLLRSRRYLDLLGHVAQVPDPEAIEELWAEEHVAHAFDYVEVETAAFEEQARAEVPADEELAAWYEALPEDQRAAYLAPERRSAEIAYFALGPEAPTAAPAALLEAYPRPAEESAEDEAQSYYNRYYFVRFRRPPAETEPGAGEETSGEDAGTEAGEEPTAGEAEEPPEDTSEEPAEDPAAAAAEEPAEDLPQYLSFDEVRDVALAEAPVYFAMERWLRDLQTRRAEGQEVSLAAEADRLGLALRVPEQPLDLEAMTALVEDLGGAPVATAVFTTQPEELAFAIQVQPQAFSVVRVAERVEPSARPFEEVREDVLEAWVDERAAELALARLADLRATLPLLSAADGAEGTPEDPAEGQDPAQEDAEDAEGDAEDADDAGDAGDDRRSAEEAAFVAAAEAQGLEVRHRGWLDRSGPLAEDPDQALPAHAFLRSRPELYELEPGEVAAPIADGERAYLVRLAGEREVPIERMSPAVYEQYKERTAAATKQAVGQGFSQSLEELYGVRFRFGEEAEGEDDVLDEDGEGEAEPAE